LAPGERTLLTQDELAKRFPVAAPQQSPRPGLRRPVKSGGPSSAKIPAGGRGRSSVPSAGRGRKSSGSSGNPRRSQRPSSERG
jgi:hypothetical protein